MTTWVLTLAYLDIPLLEHALKSFYSTSTLGDQKIHVLVDHHWPFDYWNHRHAVLRLAEKYHCKVISPYQNRGAHGGFNWAIENLPIQEDDIVIGYDGDTQAITPGWDVAMRSVLTQDPNYAAVSLFIVADLLTKEWARVQTQAGIDVLKPKQGIEMINCTGWKYSFLKKTSLLQAQYRYYGQVEAPMFELFKKHGMLHGYLADFKEIPRPFDADARYQQWKADHVAGTFTGNFDEWLKRPI